MVFDRLRGTITQIAHDSVQVVGELQQAGRAQLANARAGAAPGGVVQGHPTQAPQAPPAQQYAPPAGPYPQAPSGAPPAASAYPAPAPPTTVYPAAQPAPVQAPSFVPPVAGGQATPLTSDDRWSLIWTTVRLYYLFDATKAFALALIGMICTVAFAVSGGGDCDAPKWMGILPTSLIFVTRVVDLCSGCCGVMAGTSGAEVPAAVRQEKFRRACRHNCYICFTQLFLAVLQISFSLYTFLGDKENCGFSIVGVVFGVLLIMDAGQEVFVWVSCYLVATAQHQVELPGWLDAFVPRSFVKFANRVD